MNNLKYATEKLKIEREIARIATLRTFVNTGKKFDPIEAMADHSNPALRQTANIDSNGQLVWIKE